MKIPIDEPLQSILRAISDVGGRALLVGGGVRDHLLGIDSKDRDIEVFGMALDPLCDLLRNFGEVMRVGQAFGVVRIKGVEADFSLPRRDSKVGPGHGGFDVAHDTGMTFEQAARRRDLTINSMGYDPLSEELLDPWNGRRDLAAKRLRATDATHFGEDPLRGLRVAQFAARLRMEPDSELIRLCSELDLSELSGERMFDELNKLLLQADTPSVGFELLNTTRLLRFFPELDALRGVEQEPDWHPEGDVWVHTMMVIDEAAKLRKHDADDMALMYGALCHDLGKPETTEVIDGRTRSRGHDVAGIETTNSFLDRLKAGNELKEKVGILVRHHLAPGLYARNGAKPKAYRRLARDLDAYGVSMELLLRVATADHFGRTTEDALARVFPGGETFRRHMNELDIAEEGPRDVVMGRHLIARGLSPGPHFGPILDRCREIQDETGWMDPEQILDEAMKNGTEF